MQSAHAQTGQSPFVRVFAEPSFCSGRVATSYQKGIV